MLNFKIKNGDLAKAIQKVTEIQYFITISSLYMYKSKKLSI